MKLDWNRKYTTISVYAVLTALCIMLLGAMFLNFDAFRSFLGTLNSILTPLYIGFGIAYVANPFMKLAEKRIFKFKIKTDRGFRTKRSLSIAFAFIVLLLILTVLFLLIIPQVIVSVSDLASKLTEYVNATLVWLEDVLPESETAGDDLVDIVKTIESSLSSSDLASILYEIPSKLNTNGLNGFFTSALSIVRNYLPILFGYFAGLANGFFNVIIGIFFSLYMLSSKEKLIAQFKKTTRAFLSDKKYHGLIQLGHFTNKTFSGYLIGKVLDSLIVGVIMFICCSIFNVPYAILLSTLIAITNVIPVIGPFIGAIPGILIIFVVDPSKVLIFIILNFILQQIDGNIIVPKLLGETTGLDSLWVLFSITVMGGLWGIFGMFICVPIFAILYMVLKLAIESKLRSKELPQETSEYYSDSDISKFTVHEDNRFSFAARVKNSGDSLHHNSFVGRIKRFFQRKKNKKNTDKSENKSKKQK